MRGQKQPIAVREPVRRPSEYETVEELYINGLHLEQYRQHNYDPRDYYREGLKRDPGDIRCNTGMARLALRDGLFEDCLRHCDRAIERLTSRNQHPSDTEALYLKGLALCYLERWDEATDALYRAGWSYGFRSAAYYRLAVIDCRFGRYADALEKLEVSMGLNRGHTQAANLKCAVLRALGRVDEAKVLCEENIRFDLLDIRARLEKHALDGDGAAIREIFGGKPENFLNAAADYMEAGFVEDALRTLSLADENPLVLYYRAYCQHKLGMDYRPTLEAAAAMDSGLCFPAKLEDVAVLRFAIDENPADANACYFLGSLCYDRFRYDEAIALWEQAIERDPHHAKALRNLSIAYFDKRGDAASARVCMERAMQYRSDPRLLFEYQQLLKNSNVSPDERLAVYERYPELLAERDDCYLDRIVLLSQKGRYAEAIEAARAKHFHIYEGGEGNLTKQHAWMHVLYANELARAGKPSEAEQVYLDGVNMPKSYGEAKTFFNQEAHIYYYLGLLLEGQGRDEEARRAFEEASVYKATVSELSLFRALALRRLMRFSQARQVLEEMLQSGEKLIRDCDLRSYYGVGSPTPMPFEYDVVRQNRVNGEILRAYALLGLGRREEAARALDAAAGLDPHNFRIYAYRQIQDFI